MTVNIIARLTQINQRRSVHPSLARRVLRIRSEESVPDVDDERENNSGSPFPHIYCRLRNNYLVFIRKRQSNFNFIRSVLKTITNLVFMISFASVTL